MFKTNHHPDINLLAEYASGSLDWALSLGVATHLHFCPECREKTILLNGVGGDLLLDAKPAPVDDQVFGRLMSAIDGAGDSDFTPTAVDQLNLADVSNLANASSLKESSSPSSRSHPTKKVSGNGGDKLLSQVKLPQIIRKLLPTNNALIWKSVSPALKMARLDTGQNKYEVAFHQISAGAKVAEHGHSGVEVTIVLKGSFSDLDGIYNEGDFVVRQAGDVHRPTAAQDQDCLCISIAEAPVKLTGLLGKLINPFISFKPA